MKKSLYVMGIALAILSSGTVYARQTWSGIWPDPAWCPTCFVASYADAPVVGSTIDESTVIWFWGGNCHTGAAPTHLSATAAVNGNPETVPVSYVMGGERSDVRAHLIANGCNGGHAVVAAWFPNGFPQGTTLVSVKLHTEAVFAFHVFVVASEDEPRQSGPFVSEPLDFGTLIFRSGTTEMLRLTTEQRTVLTHTLSAREKAAAEMLMVERLRRPFALVNGNGLPANVEPTSEQIATEMAGWHAELISTALKPYLDRLDAEETKDAANEIRDLSVDECETLNATRKKAGKPVLRRCGKGGGQ